MNKNEMFEAELKEEKKLGASFLTFGSQLEIGRGRFAARLQRTF